MRYRGYYYDYETGFYYVSSRYYDPEVGRFVSADTTDVLTASTTALTDKNLYAYCDNNPVARKDAGGDYWETAFDVISLGASVADIMANPANPWAWAGLAGDVIDVAVPFVGGIGEAVKCVGNIEKTKDVVQAAKRAKRMVSKSVGTYEITYKSGKNYVGKGNFNRAIQSAERYAKPHKLNGGKGDEVLSITWKKANGDRDAFMREYLWQNRGRGVLSSKPNAKTYNRRWSPGRRYLGWWN